MPYTDTPSVQALLAKGRKCGKVTHDELNVALPEGTTSSELIEAVISMLNEAGIQVVEK